jgi:hypothetical protein
MIDRPYDDYKPTDDLMANSIANHFDDKFEKVLDIGAGIARQGRGIQKIYDNEIWILEGDAKNNNKKLPGAKKAKWHDTADNFYYYWYLDELRYVHEKIGTKKYHIIDCDDINISKDVKFDLICSWLSCGFHYPLSTYYHLFKNHSHKNTKFVFDIRIQKDQIMIPNEAKIVHTFFTEGRKYSRCEIVFDFDKIK